MMKLQKFLLIFIFCFAIKFTVCRPGNTNNVNVIENFSPITNAESSRLKATQQSELNDITRAASAHGMDPNIVEEVLRTGKPFVKSETGDHGRKQTTTYAVESDGTISRRTMTEFAPTVQIRSPTFSTSQANLPKKVNSDWEWNPTNVPQYGISLSHPRKIPQWTNTWDNPDLTSNSNEGNGNTITLPKTWNTQLWPNTETETFDTSNIGTTTKTFLNNDGTKVTSTHTVGPTKWTTRTYTYPSNDFWPRKDTESTTSVIPNVLQSADEGVSKQLPSLEDFLKSQYGTPETNNFSKTKPTTVIPNLLYKQPETPTPTYLDKPVTTININDITIMKTFNKNNPTTDEIFDIPINSSEGIDRTFKVENIPQTYTPEVRTQSKSFTRTKIIQGNEPPTLSDLDDNMKNILEKAGVNPEDILKSKDGTIVTTRQEPDGKIVKTTYRVRTVPIQPETSYFPYDFKDDNLQGPFPISSITTTPKTYYSASHSGAQFPIYNGRDETQQHDTPQGPFPISSITTTPKTYYSASHSGAQFPIYIETDESQKFNVSKDEILKTNLGSPSVIIQNKTHQPKLPIVLSSNPIDEFLKKLNMTPQTIVASNGELIKTIVDDSGRILTATFLLSSVRNEENLNKNESPKVPIK